ATCFVRYVYPLPAASLCNVITYTKGGRTSPRGSRVSPSALGVSSICCCWVSVGRGAAQKKVQESETRGWVSDALGSRRVRRRVGYPQGRSGACLVRTASGLLEVGP